MNRTTLNATRKHSSELDDRRRRLRKLEEENDTLRILLAKLHEEKFTAQTQLLRAKAKLQRAVRHSNGRTRVPE